MTQQVSNLQWLRKIGLVVFSGDKGLDLSNMRVTFNVEAADVETPNHAVIRVYNLSTATIKKIQGEFSQVSLAAGYENGPYGTIFQGTIKQFRSGNSSAVDSYFDIIAADSDEAYNFAFSNATLPAGTTPQQAIQRASQDMGASVNQNAMPDSSTQPTGGILPRGKVLFGMSRKIIRDNANNIGCSWSIQNGVVQVLPLQGYLPNEAVVLTSQTGLIGFPEQTDQGIKVTCLLNPKILAGQLIKIDNAQVNKTRSQNQQLANSGMVEQVGYQAPKPIASISADGLYRVLVVEHEGDTRGNPWYSELICLSLDPTTKVVEAKQ